jgi:glycine betaine/proline transport system substrate-binding protein
VPTYVVAEHPELATWEGFTDPANAARFRTASTGERGQFLAGDRTWVQYDADIVANLGLDFTVVFAGSEAALLAQVDAAYAGRQPILFYFWMPHAAHRRYDLTEVRLPPHSAACYARADFGGVDCDYPADVLFKIVWRGLPEYAPEAHDFITRFHWSTEQQTELLAAVDLEGMTPDDAARRWVATHEDVWREWLPH